MAPHYIITVSAGRFRVLERFARPGQLTPTLREVASHDFLPVGAAHGLREADRTPSFGGGSFLAARSGEAHGQSPEDDHRRVVDWLVEQIEHFLLARPGQAWALAAGPGLLEPILARLRPSVRGSLVESVQRNLALMPPSELATQFRVRA